MGHAKNWTKKEIAAACKAYTAATLNLVSGTAMKLEYFSDKLVEKLSVLLLLPLLKVVTT